jgi:hypothetical protein
MFLDAAGPCEPPSVKVIHERGNEEPLIKLMSLTGHFHTSHKLLMLSHSPANARLMGKTDAGNIRPLPQRFRAADRVGDDTEP